MAGLKGPLAEGQIGEAARALALRWPPGFDVVVLLFTLSVYPANV